MVISWNMLFKINKLRYLISYQSMFPSTRFNLMHIYVHGKKYITFKFKLFWSHYVCIRRLCFISLTLRGKTSTEFTLVNGWSCWFTRTNANSSMVNFLLVLGCCTFLLENHLIWFYRLCNISGQSDFLWCVINYCNHGNTNFVLFYIWLLC